MAERLNAPRLKRGEPSGLRGFESHPPRRITHPDWRATLEVQPTELVAVMAAIIHSGHRYPGDSATDAQAAAVTEANLEP